MTFYEKQQNKGVGPLYAWKALYTFEIPEKNPRVFSIIVGGVIPKITYTA